MIKEKMRGKKIGLLIIIFVGTVAIFGLANIASAQPTAQQYFGTDMVPTDITGMTAAQEAKTTGGLLYFLATIATSVLTLFAWLIEWGIKIGKEITNLNIVSAGAGAVLGFANLGFVLAIIVMAFATIFRLQSYAMKQTLWKLIVAELLVNFSEVIAGAFINVSNIFSDYFISQLQGKNLATGLTGLLAPQELVKTDPNAGSSCGIFQLSCWLKYIVSIFFILIFTLLIILVFIAIFIMLLIRAVTLAILLIIMPIVWLLWIFPATSKHWQKWWDEFLRWTFFAPIVLFFLVLVINTGNNLNQLSASIANIQAGGEITAMIQGTQKNTTLEPGFFAHVGQMLIVGALLIGGLFIANKFSITGAKEAYGAARGASKSFGGWVGRKGVRTAGYPFAQPSQRMQNWATQGGIKGTIGRTGMAVQGRLSRIPVLRNLGRAYRGPGQHQSFHKSIWAGIKGGSGLFKKGGVQDWECQNCRQHVIRQRQRPTIACPNCGAPAVAPAGSPPGTPATNWTQV